MVRSGWVPGSQNTFCLSDPLFTHTHTPACVSAYLQEATRKQCHIIHWVHCYTASYLASQWHRSNSVFCHYWLPTATCVCQPLSYMTEQESHNTKVNMMGLGLLCNCGNIRIKIKKNKPTEPYCTCYTHFTSLLARATSDFLPSLSALCWGGNSLQ